MFLSVRTSDPAQVTFLSDEVMTVFISSLKDSLLLCVCVVLCVVCCAALRSRSGRSIINGNWAIDRPGTYEGVGTMFTYRRPNEISSTSGESFLAEGPTNDILEVYVSERHRHYREYTIRVCVRDVFSLVFRWSISSPIQEFITSSSCHQKRPVSCVPSHHFFTWTSPVYLTWLCVSLQ